MKKDKVQEPPAMLRATVNCSIGDKSLHLKSDDLVILLSGGHIANSALEQYAIKTIKTEALKKEIDDFISFYKIPKEKAYQIIYG
jgi:hypothetical protein